MYLYVNCDDSSLNNVRERDWTGAMGSRYRGRVSIRGITVSKYHEICCKML